MPRYFSLEETIVNTPQIRAHMENLGERQIFEHTSLSKTNVAAGVVTLDRKDDRVKVVLDAELDHG